MRYPPIISALRKQRQEDQEFQIIPVCKSKSEVSLTARDKKRKELNNCKFYLIALNSLSGLLRWLSGFKST